jgi:hypothetical protein
MPEYDGKNELRIFYGTSVGSVILPHRITIDFKQDALSAMPPGTPFASVPVSLHDGSTSNLGAQLTALLAVVRPNYRPTTEFSHAEYWAYLPEPSEDAVFMGAETLALQGTAPAGTDTAAQQDLWTFRTVLGGIMKFQLMESVSVSNLKQTPPFAPSTFEAVRTYFIGLTHPWVGRDDSRPLAAVALSSGQNEKLWRKRFRP